MGAPDSERGILAGRVDDGSGTARNAFRAVFHRACPTDWQAAGLASRDSRQNRQVFPQGSWSHAADEAPGRVAQRPYRRRPGGDSVDYRIAASAGIRKGPHRNPEVLTSAAGPAQHGRHSPAAERGARSRVAGAGMARGPWRRRRSIRCRPGAPAAATPRAPSRSGAAAFSESGAGPAARAESGSNTAAGSRSDSRASTVTHSRADSRSDSGANAGANAGAHSFSNSDSDSNSNSNPDSDSNSDADSNAGVRVRHEREHVQLCKLSGGRFDGRLRGGFSVCG